MYKVIGSDNREYGPASEETVQPVCDSSYDKDYQSQHKTLIEQQRYKHGNEYHPENGEQVRDGNNTCRHSGGYFGTVMLFGLN